MAIEGLSRVGLFGMTERICARVARCWRRCVVSGIALSGCMGSPTYGTDKTAATQLADDLTGAISIAPKRNSKIDYKPRPELVKPGPGAEGSAATAAGQHRDGERRMAQSPEQRRARLRAMPLPIRTTRPTRRRSSMTCRPIRPR